MHKDIYTFFSHEFRKLRTEKGLTIEALSDKSFISVSTIKRIESKTLNTIPSFNVLNELGISLNTNLHEILVNYSKRHSKCINDLMDNVNRILESSSYSELFGALQEIKSLKGRIARFDTIDQTILKKSNDLENWISGLVISRVDGDYDKAIAIFLHALGYHSADEIFMNINKFSKIELHILNSIAVCLMFMEEYRVAEQLLTYIASEYSKDYIDDKYLFIKITFNLCAIHKKKKNYDIARLYADLGIEYCNLRNVKIKFGNFYLKRVFISLEMGHTEINEEINQALDVLRAENKHQTVENVKTLLNIKYDIVI